MTLWPRSQIDIDCLSMMQAMTLLNHAGVCMSYSATWEHLLFLTQEANFLSKVQTGHWIWAYDNLNVHRVCRHERKGIANGKSIYHYCIICIIGVHSQMLNLTTRLALRIESVPDWFDWTDESPQGNRSQLKADDILPSLDDTQALHDRAVIFLQQFMVQKFRDLSELEKFAPIREFNRKTKTEIVPMKVLFKDEKYAAENVSILRDLIRDANLGGTHQVKCRFL